MERLDRIALNTSFSIHSLAEGSEVISEVEEIQEVIYDSNRLIARCTLFYCYFN